MSSQQVLSDLDFINISKIINLPTPSNDGDGVNKLYVDTGLNLKADLDASNLTAGDITAWLLKLDVEAGAQVNPTNLEIKTSYEANADTNAFTDAEKTKLDALVLGATINSSDAFLLNRANHTGTQLSSSISDFDSAVSVNSAVLANTAKVSYPTVDASKLAGIEAGATADQTGVEIVALLETLGGTDRLFIEAIDDSSSAVYKLMTSAERTKLSNIEPNAQVNYTPINSLVLDSTNIKLVNDLASPGNNYFYGTTSGGVKGWRALTSLTLGGTTSVTDLIASAFVRVGNTVDNTSGNIRYTGTAFEGSVGGVWVPLSAEGAGTGNITAGADLTLNAVMVGQGTTYAATSSVLVDQAALVVGTTTGTTEGSIRYNAGVFEGRNASAWVSLGSSADAVTSSVNLTTDTLVLGNAGDKTVKTSTILSDGGSLIFGDSTTGTTDGGIKYLSGVMQVREAGTWLKISSRGLVTDSTTGPVTLTLDNSGVTYTNEGAAGAVEHTLPVITSSEVGTEYKFIVKAAQTLQVTANTGQTIRVASSVSTSAGNITSSAIGDVITLKSVSTTEWYAVSYIGTWTTA